MISDPIAVKFSNEQVRVLAEAARAFKAAITSASNDWYGGINNLFPNDSTVLDDGRTNEGVNTLTGADVNSAMSVLIAAAGQLNDQIVAKPCVRPLQIEG